MNHENWIEILRDLGDYDFILSTFHHIIQGLSIIYGQRTTVARWLALALNFILFKI